MKGLLKYGALVTKIHAIRGEMMTEEKYKKLASSANVRDAVDYITKNTPYAAYLREFGGSVHRASLEKALRSAVFDDYIKLKNYLTKNDAALVEAVMRRYEIDFLKNAVRNCMSDLGIQRFTAYDTSLTFRRFVNYDFESVVAAGDMPQLTDALSGSPYGEVLKTLYSRGRQPTLFEIETALDLFYFRNIQSVVKKNFEKADAEKYSRIVGTEADILNLLWIYRCKKYYNMQKEFIYTLIIPLHGMLTRAQLRDIIESDDTEQAVKKYKIGRFVNDGYTGAISERAHLRAIIRVIERAQKRDPYSVAAVMSYLLKKELETENLCSVIEGVRYNLKRDKIMTYVVV